MKLVILAGGYGTRITEETRNIPKPMVMIGNRPIIWHIIRYYIHYGISDIIVCCGYKGKIIKNYFHSNNKKRKYFRELIESSSKPLNILTVDTGLNSMTGGRIKKIYEYIKKDNFFYLTYGDGLSNINLDKSLKLFLKTNKLGLVTAVRQPSRFGLMKLKGNFVKSFIEKPIGSNLERINGGFFILKPEVINFIKNKNTVWEQEPLKRLSKKNELIAYLHNGFWHPMDTLRDKILLTNIWKSNNCPWRIW